MLVTAVHRFAGQQGDHLLLTAVNEGSKSCWVTSYPAVVLDWNVDNHALPHSKKDAPRAATSTSRSGPETRCTAR